MAVEQFQDAIVTLTECAASLNVSAAWLRRECAEGRLPYVPSYPEPLLSMRAIQKNLLTRAQYVPPREKNRLTD